MGDIWCFLLLLFFFSFFFFPFFFFFFFFFFKKKKKKKKKGSQQVGQRKDAAKFLCERKTLSANVFSKNSIVSMEQTRHL